MRNVRQGGKLTDEKAKISQQIYTYHLHTSRGMHALLRTGFSIGSGGTGN